MARDGVTLSSTSIFFYTSSKPVLTPGRTPTPAGCVLLPRGDPCGDLNPSPQNSDPIKRIILIPDPSGDDVTPSTCQNDFTGLVRRKNRESSLLLLDVLSLTDPGSSAHAWTGLPSIVIERACSPALPQFYPNSHCDKKLSSCQKTSANSTCRAVKPSRVPTGDHRKPKTQ